MKKRTLILLILLTLILSALWFLGSWWYYTKLRCDCDLANNTKENNTVSESNKLATTSNASKTITPPPSPALSQNIEVTDTDSDGLSDAEEQKLGTDPRKSDTDGDGIPDNEELGAELSTPIDTDKDSIIDALDTDDDNDGLSTLIEGQVGTSPLLKDTDGDGLDDIKEVGNINETIDTDNDGTINALDVDDDDDGLSTASEILLGTNHLLADSDSDGISDKEEIGELTNNPNDSDSDGTIDALDNEDNTDSDNDGISDIDENKLGTDPSKTDSDGDGIGDIEEIGSNYDKPLDTDENGVINALDTDDDGDTVSTLMESVIGTNPLSSDSDGDGLADADEIGSDPKNPLDSNKNGLIDALDKIYDKQTDKDMVASTEEASTSANEQDETSTDVSTPVTKSVKDVSSTDETPNLTDDKTPIPVKDDETTSASLDEISSEIIKEADDSKPESVRLYFPFNSEKSKVSGELAQYFESLSNWTKENPKRMISITGHTDNIGDEKQNLALGMRRVMVIRELLIDAGTPYQQIDVISRGEREPIADNGSEEGRFKNRRVELYPIPASKK